MNKREHEHVPVIADGLRVRKAEPVAYSPSNFEIYEFNDDGYQILRLVDGRSTVSEIASKLADDDQELAGEIVDACLDFLSSCVAQGFVQWKA
jgi:hypothetical protein